jgi:3-ketosteroid 9alpha-monooxygenase subunit B
MTPDVPSQEAQVGQVVVTSRVSARLGGDDHTFSCPAGSTLLDAALEAGLLVPHSCREGHCGACITRLTAGSVTAMPGAALSRRDRLKGRILCCRSRPTSAEVTIDYDT